jgi:hypothetical protein
MPSWPCVAACSMADLKITGRRAPLEANFYVAHPFRVVSEFQNHIADQHQHFVSCKKCRHLSKQMSALSKKIERGVR